MNNLTEEEKKQLTLAAMTVHTPAEEAAWWNQKFIEEAARLQGQQH